MIIHLKSVKSTGEQQGQLVLEDNLPDFLQAPCQINYQYRLQKERNYTLLSLKVSGTLHCICQRCLTEFSQEYHNATTLALCDSEELASELMLDYESVVVSEQMVNLSEVIRDELYLYVPQQHATVEECDPLMMRYLV